MSGDKKPSKDIETVPDGWERFERTMDKIVPPKPHKESQTKKNAGGDRRQPKKSS